MDGMTYHNGFQKFGTTNKRDKGNTKSLNVPDIFIHSFKLEMMGTGSLVIEVEVDTREAEYVQLGGHIYFCRGDQW